MKSAASMGRTGAPGVGHAPCHDHQGFGELKAGEVGAEAVVHALLKVRMAIRASRKSVPESQPDG